MTWEELRRLIDKYFDLEEVRGLCFALDVDYDSLRGEGKEAKVRELVTLLRRQGRIPELVNLLSSRRPNITWEEPKSSDSLADTPRLEYEESFLKRAEDQWVKQKLEVEASKERWIGVSKVLNGVRESGKMAEILGADKAALVLGELGSGKTIALCALARELIVAARRDPSQRLPVVLDVSSWKLDEEEGKREHFADWFVREFTDEYRAGNRLGRSWLENDRTLLMLDGLDQISSDHRRTFVEAINDYYEDRGWFNIIIVCRTDVYENLDPKPKVPNIIELRPLDDGLSKVEYQQKLSTYLAKLEDAGEPLGSLRNLLEGNEDLRRLVNTPLMLRLMIDVYKKKPEKVLAATQLENLDEARNLLSGAYIDGQFDEINQEARKANEKPKYDPGDVRRWLNWMARNKTQTRFYIEHIQPDWLPVQKQVWYRVYASLVTVLIAGLPAGTVFGLALAGPYNDLTRIEALVAGWSFGLILGLGGAWSYFFLPDGWLSALGMAVAAFLASFAMFRLAQFSTTGGLALGIVMAVVAFVLAQVTGVLRNKRKILIETFSFSWKKALINSAFVLVFGLVLGWTSDAVLGEGWFRTVVTVSVFGALIVFGYFFKTEIDWESVAIPNGGIHRSFRNAIKSGLVFFVLGGISIFIVSYLFGKLAPLPLWDGGPVVRLLVVEYEPLDLYVVSGFRAPLAVGTFVGMMMFLLSGGLTVIKHYVLRFSLQNNGGIPAGEYTGFFDYASDRLNFLSRIGAGYEFIRDLQSYFATLNGP